LQNWDAPIIAIANPLIKEKIQRNETVIKLLQQFNLNPEQYLTVSLRDVYDGLFGDALVW